MTNQAKLTVREAKVEGARLALEAACRAVCKGCRRGIHVNKGDWQESCDARKIRALKPEEVVDGK